MSKCYEIIPLDTWFFRGSTPMESGMMNVVSIFPPPVSVVKGAFWTAFCNENRNSDYGDGSIPFDVTAMFIKKVFEDGKTRFYVPAPATWYYDSDKKIIHGKDLENIKKIEAEYIEEILSLEMKTSAGSIVYTKSENEPISLNGSWVSLDFIKNPKKNFSSFDVLFSSDIYSSENRTNVALDLNKKAKDGQLFSSTHIRMNAGITLVVQFNKDVGENEKLLSDEGKFYFGGEKRVSSYKKCDLPELNNEEDLENSFYMSLVPVEATEESLKTLVSSGKIFVTAGWNLKTKFHKPTVNWLPAGAVFNKQINNSCVLLTQTK